MMNMVQKNIAAPAPKAAPKAKAETSTKGGASLKVRDLRTDWGAVLDGKLQAKLAIITDAKQALARAKDTIADAKALAAEADRINGETATKLYQARRDDILPDAELSAVLGDIYGYKIVPSTGKPSKTPDGAGETIRKKVRYAVAAYEAFTGGPVTKSFAEYPADKIEDAKVILASLDAGKIGVYTAAEQIADLRKEARTTVEKAFDPKHIRDLVDILGREGAADKVRASADLIDAYARLKVITDAIFIVPAE